MLIDAKSFFDVPVKNKEQAYKKNMSISKNNDYTTGNLLDKEYFLKHYKLIVIDLSKQIKLGNPDLRQKVNLLATKFATKKRYVIDSQTTKGKYKQGDTIKFETKTFKSSLCDHSDAFILVTGNITIAANNDTDVAFKNCAPFSTCTTKINDIFVDEVNHIYIAMPMYNLIEYSNNYSDTSGCLRQFKRDEVTDKNADLTINNSQSALLRKTADAVTNTNSSAKDAKKCCSIKVFE